MALDEIKQATTVGGDGSFTEGLDEEAMKYFNEVCAMKFSDQACAFLNAYWQEIGDQAEFVYACSYDQMKYADMHAKGIQYVHLYEEGNDVDFNIGLYFYEKLCKRVEEAKDETWSGDEMKPSQPTMMTAIKRKAYLKKVDVNFDGRISFLEYLLDQYKEHANPADFCQRAMPAEDVDEELLRLLAEIEKAKKALEEVNKRIKAYETEKHRLTEGAKLPGVKGLKFKNLLAQLEAGPLAEELNKALITAEAAVRIAGRKFRKYQKESGSQLPGKDGEKRKGKIPDQSGAIWWLERDLAEKKARYGPRKK